MDHLLENAEKILGRLTTRQRQVLVLMAQGKRNREIAATLAISRATVADHIHKIYQSMDLILDRRQLVQDLVRVATQRGMLP